MDVFGIFVVVSFMCLIVTLVVMTIVKKIKKSQELFVTGKIEPVVGYKCDSLFVDDYSWHQREINETQEKYLETVPSHKTRVKNRNKRQRKK